MAELIATTNGCRRFGHPEFRFSYDPAAVIALTVASFIRQLEDGVSSGEVFRPGETFQIGWMITRITEHSDGFLGFLEPDMKTFPVREVPGLTSALCHLRLHKDVCESLFDPPQLSFAPLWHSAIVCTRLGTTPTFIMDRAASEGNVSGWFFGCDAESHDHQDVSHLRCVSIYEAVVTLERRILPFLLLPEQTLVAAGDGPPRVWHEDTPRPFLPGSYLSAFYSTH